MILIYSSLMALQKEGKVKMNHISYFVLLDWNTMELSHQALQVKLTQYNMLVHPSIVMHWKTVNMANRILSKEVIP